MRRNTASRQFGKIKYLVAGAAGDVAGLPEIVNHGDLLNLLDDDHTQYLHLTTPRTVSAQHTFAPGSAAPPFLLGANAQGQTVTGLRADQLNKSVLAGNGLSGGGLLTANRTLSVNQGYAFNWTATHHFANPTYLDNTANARSILPQATDTYDIGSDVLLWRKGWLSELDTILFSKNTVTLLGGWLLVGPNEGALAADVAAAATSIDFGQAMTVGHFILFRSALKLEYMQVGALVSGTTYNVTRNLDGSGANDWPAGAPYSVLGTDGSGRIELNAYDTPRISVIRQGATYNAQTERVRFGDLAGWQGAGLTGYGWAAGDYAGNEYAYYSPSTGQVIRGTVRADDGYLNNLDITGTLKTGSSPNPRIEITPTMLAGYSDATTRQFYLQSSDGKAYAGGGVVKMDSTGLTVSSTAYGYNVLTDPNSPYIARFGPMKVMGGTGISAGTSMQRAGLYMPYDDDDTTTLELSLGGVGTDGVSIVRLTHNNITLEAQQSTAASTYSRATLNYSTGLLLEGSTDSYGTLSYTGNLRARRNSTFYTGYIYVPLSSPVTNVAWNNHSYGTVAAAVLDLSSLFGIPAGVKAVNIQIRCNDSATWGTNDLYVAAGPSTTYFYQMTVPAFGGDIVSDQTGIVNCNANGDIAVRIKASGTGTMDVTIRIWGYYI